MANCCKEEGQKSGPDMDTSQIKTENHGHTFRFRYGNRNHKVTCNSPTTVHERLQTDYLYRAICKNGLKRQKEVVILREKHRAAVMPNFPCSLLNDNELLDIEFIRSGGNSGPVKTWKPVHSHENFVSFYIKTRGGEDKIRKVMNKAFKRVDYVCVYAVKGERMKAALKRDGRFIPVIYRKGTLYEHETMDTVNMSTLVDDLDGKLFEIIMSHYQMGSQESSQEMDQEFETVKDEKSEVPETPQATNTNQESTNTQEKKTETPVEEKKPRKYPATREIPNTKEILKILREQYGDLLKILKEREKLKNNGEVKKFFREEYDKSAQSFTEVKRVKWLMMLSNSVCQIRSDGLPRGTGFLLFNRFILTNAHVVGDLLLFTRKMKQKLTAVFEFEDLNSGIEIPLEETVVAFLKDKDGMGNYLDFALLELNSDLPDGKYPELLKKYSPPPTRGGVCIIGHPEGGVKRMDPCFMIAKEDRERAAESYYEMNHHPEVYHVITQQCLAEDSEKRKSQITYHSCFFHGSSGSPVFDEQCNLIGVHTGGYCYGGEGNKTRSVMEYALPMLPILVQIYIQCHDSGRDDVLRQVMNQNNMDYILHVANEQLKRNHQDI